MTSTPTALEVAQEFASSIAATKLQEAHHRNPIIEENKNDNVKGSRSEAIQAEVYKALEAISGGAPCTYQLAILNKGKGGKSYLTYGYFNDWNALTEQAYRHTVSKDVQSVYVNLQDIHTDCIARAENKMLSSAKAVSANDVVLYRHFLVDVDRAGIKDISANAMEKEQIRQVLEEIREYLVGELGWPDPAFLGDSGNGYHQSWSVSLPVNKETQALFKQCYQVLQQKFGSDVISIDASLADPNQLIKLYGTVQRKGDNTKERPWRWSKLLTTYDTEVVSIEQLQALAAHYKPTPKAPGATTTSTQAARTDLWWLARTPEAVEEWAKDAGITLDTRTDDGNGFKWRVDCLTSDAHTDGAAIILNSNGYLKYKCHHASCANKTVSDILALHPAPIKRKEKSTKKPTKRITATEYCTDYIGDVLKPKWKVIRVHNGTDEQVTIKACQGKQMDGVIYYTIEESSDVVPDTELFVEIDARDLSERWLDLLRELGYTLKLNVLEDMVEVDGKRLDDITRSKIYLRMRAADEKIPKHYVDDLINVLAAENTYHPVQDYLNSLVWDGKNHLEAMLLHIRGDDREVLYPNGDRAQLHWLLIRRWLLGCVARALDGDKDGAFKHQTPMLVLIGKQGLGKSSWVRWLVSGVGYEFHRESSINPHGTEDVRSMVTKWIWEASELGSSLRRGDRDALKGFITQEWHTYRKPWGRANITKPTLCNFVGTINPEVGFLDDPTGHRRFLPVNITALNHDYKKVVDVNQLWAQLVHLYKNGTSPELSKLEKQALATTYEEHEVENPLETYLQMYFTIKPDDDTLKCFTAEIMQRLQVFGINISNNPKVAGREINDVLAPMKLTRKLLSIGGVKGWGWVGIEPNGIMPPPHP